MVFYFMLMTHPFQQLLNCQPPEKAMTSNQLVTEALSLLQDAQADARSSIFSTTEVALLDPSSETQDYTMERESSMRQQDQSHQEVAQNGLQKQSSWPQHAFYFQIESPSIFENSQDYQKEEGNKKGKQPSQNRNFPKFFIQDILAALRKSDNQQKNQSKLMQHYKTFALSHVKQSIKSLQMLFIEGKEDAPAKKSFLSSAQKRKIDINPQDVDIAPLKKYLRNLLLGNAKNIFQNAEGRKIRDKNRLREYLQFVSLTMDDIGQGKLRGKAKIARSIRQRRDDQ